MAIYLKQFSTHSEYEQYINGSDVILPNVSICTTEGDVHYNPYVEPPTPTETRVVAKFNVTNTSKPTAISYYYKYYDDEEDETYIYDGTTGFSAIEVDGVELPSVVSAYTFSTTGEHTVKYTLKDPTTIGNWAFRGCSGLTSISIPNSVTTIGSATFLSCSGMARLNSDVDGVFNIPSGVTSIGQSTFNHCTSLTSVTIPSCATSISIGAFYGCTGLTSIMCNATTAPTIDSTTFREVSSNGILTVPNGSSGYNTWMQNTNYYLGLYNWTKVEQ